MKMADTYEVLQPDGTVREFDAGQFEEIRRVRSRAEHEELRANGWIALDEEIEEGEAAQPKAAWKQAITETVVPPAEAPEVVIYVLGRLKPGEEGRQVV
jgi:hypothetical protein